MNSTIEKFRHKETLIKDYNKWVILLRPKQITIGSLIIACKEDAESFSAISADSCSEFYLIVKEVEQVLHEVFNFDKINYLALMMEDKHVHFHVLPRYSDSIIFNGVYYKDIDWPKAPNLSKELEFEKEDFNKLRMVLSKYFLNNE